MANWMCCVCVCAFIRVTHILLEFKIKTFYLHAFRSHFSDKISVVQSVLVHMLISHLYRIQRAPVTKRKYSIKNAECIIIHILYTLFA